MKANLKDAVLIAIVAETPLARKGPPGEQKAETPLCQDLTVEELTALNGDGEYANDCDNPDELAFCQDIAPEKLTTGRVECIERPVTAGDLLAIDHDGETFSVLPSLPSWNQVTRIQKSGNALLVTLQMPVKLLRADATIDYCHVLYYDVDTTNEAIVPYCYEYEYTNTFCFGPEQRVDWGSMYGLYEVAVSREAPTYEESLEQFEDAAPEICVTRTSHPESDSYTPAYSKGVLGVHVTPNALFEPYTINQNAANGEATRIIVGDEDAFYPMDISSYTQKGILSAGTYYAFDSAHDSITALLSEVPIHQAGAVGWVVFESGARILYTGGANTMGITSVELDFFDTETLEDGSFVIDISPHPAASLEEQALNWNLLAFLGDYLFLQENSLGVGRFYRVDTRAAQPIIELIHTRDDDAAAESRGSVVMNGYAVNASTWVDSDLPFVAYLMKPDGTLLEVNAAMLGFNPQTIEIEDDQMVVEGMAGLTPKRFILNPLATESGELLVETAGETIVVKTLIPLQ